MSTTGTFAFDPTLDDIFAEAFERAGVDPAAPGGRHLKSFFRSLRYMLNSEWSLVGVRQWMVEQADQVLTVGSSSFDLPAGAIDVTEAVLIRDARHSEMYVSSRNEFLLLVDPLIAGRPDRYYVERRSSVKTFHFWRVADRTDTIRYNYFRQMEDVGGALQNTLQLPAYAQEAMIAGLSAHLARKFNKAAFPDLWAYYWGPDINNPGGVLNRMRMEDREKGDIELMGVFEPRTARR